MQEQRRRSARRLRGSPERGVEAAAQVKAEFLAMSHEIRTPLTSILGFASLLAGKDPGRGGRATPTGAGRAATCWPW